MPRSGGLAARSFEDLLGCSVAFFSTALRVHIGDGVVLLLLLLLLLLRLLVVLSLRFETLFDVAAAPELRAALSMDDAGARKVDMAEHKRRRRCTWALEQRAP